MYNENYEEKKRFPIKDFLIRLVLIIIFVLLLIWFLPMPNLKGIQDAIFSNNVEKMKDASINYFTTERLPQNVGDKVTLTLKEMLDLKLLLPFTDKDGNTCDTERSYVTIEKKETEYLMTVHLKCGKQEDEIVVHLGCYEYCTTAVCEKVVDDKPTSGGSTPGEKTPEKPVSGPSCVLMISSGKLGNNGWYTGDVVVKYKSKTSTGGAKITDYGIGTSHNYDGKASYTVTEDGVTKVYGYVKDSNGKTAVCSVEVKKDTVKPDCSLSVFEGSKNPSGEYISNVVVGFSSKTDKTSGVDAFGIGTSSTPNYNSKTKHTITHNGTTKVYGHVKDKAGNVKTCDISIKKTKPEGGKESIPNCELYIKSGNKGDNNWYINNVVVGFKSKGSTNGATIVAHGIGTGETYGGNNAYTIDKDGTHVIRGYVKDSNGNKTTCSVVVKRDATKPNCDLSVISGTMNSEGNYTSNVTAGFKSKTDNLSGVSVYGLSTSSNTTYNSKNTLTITNNGTTTVYGYIRDKAGNFNTCSIKFKKVALEYEWLWERETSDQYSNWGPWTTKEYNKNNPPKWGLSGNGLSYTEDLGKTTTVKYTVGSAIYQKQIVDAGTITEKTCAGWTYYRDQTSTTKTYAISVSDGAWKDVGLVSLKGAPTDTLAIRYIYVGEDWDRCGENNCTTTPYTIWKKQKRNVSTVTATDTITSSSGVSVKCTKYEYKTTKLYNSYNKIVGYNKIRTEVEVYKYRIKYRTLISNGKTEQVWSTYENPSLVAQGWKRTNTYRVKN